MSSSSVFNRLLIIPCAFLLFAFPAQSYASQSLSSDHAQCLSLDCSAGDETDPDQPGGSEDNPDWPIFDCSSTEDPNIDQYIECPPAPEPGGSVEDPSVEPPLYCAQVFYPAEGKRLARYYSKEIDNGDDTAYDPRDDSTISNPDLGLSDDESDLDNPSEDYLDDPDEDSDHYDDGDAVDPEPGCEDFQDPSFENGAPFYNKGKTRVGSPRSGKPNKRTGSWQKSASKGKNKKGVQEKAKSKKNKGKNKAAGSNGKNKTAKKNKNNAKAKKSKGKNKSAGKGKSKNKGSKKKKRSVQ